MGALEISVSPAWLAIASTLLARIARDGADYNLSEEAITRIARLVENGLTVVLRVVRDFDTMKENPDIVYGFLSFANAVSWRNFLFVVNFSDDLV